ncbi:MAG: shikimate dehydrogenase family protein [Solirubrobacteraceae bacterium]
MGQRRLGVLGWPVAHSRSPQMMAAAFAARSMPDWRYQRLPVPPELFAETARALPGAGFLGANVTIPHKEAALALAEQASEAARQIGAANTLSFEDGIIRAENTDAGGLIAALRLELSGLRALVLGAGGSARAAVWALRREGAEVLIWNRTPARAERLARELGARAVSVPPAADLLVNCTSVGLTAPGRAEAGARGQDVSDSAGGEAALNQLALRADQVGRYPHVFDLVYSDQPTALLAAARAAGATTRDGIDMLVAQGALSFELWTGVAAPIEAMRAAAREPLG